ncbi:MAG: hypothetical protein ACR2RF_00335 [Geminicoccaceae bacterium]
MARRHFRFRRGITLSVAVVARKEDGTVIDLTGLTGTAVTWRITSADRRTNKITKTIGSGITVDDADDGEMTFKLDPADTADLAPNLYSHAAEVTESGGDVTPIFFGMIDLERDEMA